MKTMFAALLLIAIGGIGGIGAAVIPADSQETKPEPRVVETRPIPENLELARMWRTVLETRDLPTSINLQAATPRTYTLVETPDGLVQVDTRSGSAKVLARGESGALEGKPVAAPSRRGLTHRIEYSYVYAPAHLVGGAHSFEVLATDAGTLLHDTHNGALWQLEQVEDGFAWASTDPTDPRPGDAHLGVTTRDTDDGLRISGVVASSAAATVGLRANDIIEEVNGRAVTSDELATLIKGKNAGDTIKLKINRSGTTFTLEITLGEYK